MTHEWIDLVAEEARIVALSMVREKGRGAVLVGAARVDAALEALLKSALGPPQGSETPFSHGSPPGFVRGKNRSCRPAQSD